MKIKIQGCFALGDTTLVYRKDMGSGRIGLTIYPTTLTKKLAVRRETLAGLPEIETLPRQFPVPRAWNVESLIQLHLRGDAVNNGFSNGRSMRNSVSVDRFVFQRLKVIRSKAGVRIITFLATPEGHGCEHHLTWKNTERGFRTTALFHNRSTSAVTLEMLGSFSLGGITPFARDDAPGRLVLHRFRSFWAAEGRLESTSLEELHMERSWSGHGVMSERFGQVGSMPVRGYFPFVAIEDREAGVIWGAQLAWAGSWQMEAYRRDDTVSLSGGLADREFGQWFKTVQPGESFQTPVAHIAVGHENLDAFCQRLTSLQAAPLKEVPAVERDLPIACNEFCTTWGTPSEVNLLKIIERIKNTPVRYLVIDAGWYLPKVGGWSDSHGDWIPSEQLFPRGLASTAARIKSAGLIPGLWFELETCGPKSAAFSLVDHLLKLDGATITVRGRRFWDMCDPWVVDNLSKKVIDLLKSCGFGYLKVDYNETLGIGCDGAESPGEGLRRQIEGTYSFFRSIREALPGLVIENCSSGGHRLEPSMMALSSMASFSDAHETVEGPIIAANLHRLILPRQSQIWSTLRVGDSARRLTYSLASAFLGRMCLSGDLPQLRPSQWELAQRAMALYQRACPIIRMGVSQWFGPQPHSMRHPVGWQGVIRVAGDGSEALAVCHSFGKPVPAEVALELSNGPWKLADRFCDPKQEFEVRGNKLIWKPGGQFAGGVAFLARK